MELPVRVSGWSDADQLRPLFKDIFGQVQRGKVLEDHVFLRHHVSGLRPGRGARACAASGLYRLLLAALSE